MKRFFTLWLLLLPLVAIGQTISRTELSRTNALIDARITNAPTVFNPVYPTNQFAIGSIYSGRGAYAFYGDDEELVWGGIRTNSTLAKLALYAYRGTSGSGSNTHLLIEAQRENYGLFEFGSSIGGANFTAETTDTQIDFSIKYGSIQKVFLRADATSGYVGINTNAPKAALHVNGDAIVDHTLYVNEFLGLTNAIVNYGVASGIQITDSAGDGDFLLGTVSGQVPTWNGSAWIADIPSGAISGADTRVVFFDGTDSPAGDGGITYNKTTDALTVGGSVTASNGFTSVAGAGQGGVLSLFSSNSSGVNGKAFSIQAGLIATNVTWLAPTNGWNGLTPPVLLIVSNFVGDANGTTGQLHYISQSVLLGNSQATNSALTFFQTQDTNSFIPTRVTNYAYAASIVIDLSTHVEASITNSITGGMNILFTNTVPGRGFNLYGTSDASTRTLVPYCDKSITMLSTNETTSGTNINTTASKDILAFGKVRQKTATSTNLYLAAKSQP